MVLAMSNLSINSILISVASSSFFIFGAYFLYIVAVIF